MTEETLFKLEKKMDSAEIAEYLRNIADKIESRQTITLESGIDKVSVETDRDSVFEVKVEREDDEESLELEIEWKNSKSDNFKIS